MNTSTMEMNLNEMETVNGGSFIESLVRIGYSAQRVGNMFDCGLPLGYTLGAIAGFCEGVYDEIAGEGFAA